MRVVRVSSLPAGKLLARLLICVPQQEVDHAFFSRSGFEF